MKTRYTTTIEVDSDTAPSPELVARVLRTILNTSNHPLAENFKIEGADSQDALGFTDDDLIDLDDDGEDLMEVSL